MANFQDFVATADYLRRMDGEDIVSQLSYLTTREFDHARRENPQPVIICAYNEERELPAALVTLATSSIEILPVVVDNASTDRTAEFARKMGAVVLKEETPGKTASLETGLQWVHAETDTSIVLATDADSMVNPEWARYMAGYTQKHVDPERGGVVFGRVIVRYGESGATDTIRTLFLNSRQLAFKAIGRRPGARGSNTALMINETLLTGIQSIPKTSATEVVQDIVLRDTVREHGGTAHYAPSRKGTVLTDGDRFNSVSGLVRAIGGRMKRAPSYADDYPNVFENQ